MINVIGLGYIGLPTALMMASHGVEVIGTDYNKELVATLNAGKTTFKEDGLDELFNAAVKAGIKFTTEYQKTDMYIVSVPTPYDKFSKKVDACYVVAAVKEVMKVCPKGATVVVESTVSPGTMESSFVRLSKPMASKSARTSTSFMPPNASFPATWFMNFCTTTAPSEPTAAKSEKKSRNTTLLSVKAKSLSPTSVQQR